MKTKANYHTHHYLCGHANGGAEDYVLQALKHGYKEIGISDHGPLPVTPPFARMTYEEFENIYLKDIEDTITKYGDKIKILKSLEMEYVFGHDDFYKELLTKVDYLILAGHYRSGDAEVMKLKSTFHTKTEEDLLEYTNLLIKAMNTGCFKILAHPDIFIASYGKFDEFAISCVKRIVQAAIDNDVALEFNCEGIRRGKLFCREDGEFDYQYPNRYFWEIVSSMNAKVVIDSDCHEPEKFADEAIDTAIELTTKYKLNVIETLIL